MKARKFKLGDWVSVKVPADISEESGLPEKFNGKVTKLLGPGETGLGTFEDDGENWYVVTDKDGVRIEAEESWLSEKDIGGLTEQDVEAALAATLEEEEFPDYLEGLTGLLEDVSVQTFEDAGILTSNRGLVLRIGRREFQITIVASK